MHNNDELKKEINKLFGNISEFDKLFEMLGIYLDAIIYILIEREIVDNTELERVLQMITDQNNNEKLENPTHLSNIDFKIGFMNPVIGEA